MKIARFRHSAEAAVAVLLISGAGIAFAGNGTTPAAAPAVAPAVAPVVEPVEPAGVDTDTLQQGDQTTPDVAPAAVTAKTVAAAVKPAAKSAAAAETTTESATETTIESATESATETTGTEEPGDAGLPGGGHTDNPADANADHQFDGVE